MRRLVYWLITVGVLELILTYPQLAVLAFSSESVKNIISYEVLPGIFIGIDKTGARIYTGGNVVGFITNNTWLFVLFGLIISLILFVYLRRNGLIMVDAPLLRISIITLTILALILSMPLPLSIGNGILVLANIYKGFASILYALTSLITLGHVCLLRKKREAQIEDLIYETSYGG